MGPIPEASPARCQPDCLSASTSSLSFAADCSVSDSFSFFLSQFWPHSFSLFLSFFPPSAALSSALRSLCITLLLILIFCPNFLLLPFTLCICFSLLLCPTLSLSFLSPSLISSFPLSLHPSLCASVSVSVSFFFLSLSVLSLCRYLTLSPFLSV